MRLIRGRGGPPGGSAAMLMRLFYAVFFLCFGWTALHVVIYGNYDYQELLLVALILCALAVLAGAWRMTAGREEALKKHGAQITACVLVPMGVVQMAFCAMLRFSPLYDLGAVYYGAIEWARLGSFPDYYEYFYYFPNNLGPLCFLRGVFGLADAVGVRDWFMAAAAVNSLFSLAAVYASGAVCEKLLGVRGKVLAYLMFLISLPFYVLAPAFYTDTLSMPFPILAYWLYLLAKEQTRPGRRWLYVGLMGLAVAFGVLLKPTVGIVLIAIAADALLTWDWKRALALLAACLALIGGGRAAMNGLIYNNDRHLKKSIAEIANTPPMHWVMMGLSDYLGYNPEDYVFTRSFLDLDERDAAILERTVERVRAWGADGLVWAATVKGDICFGDGTYGLSEFFDDEPSLDNWLRRTVVAGGAHYTAYRHLCAGVLFALYALMLLSCLWELFEARSATFQALVPRLSVFGLWLFLIFWEARPRYILNYAPMIVVSAALGLGPFRRVTGRVLGRLARTRRQMCAEPPV